jgi:hypothetical protein
MRLTVHSESWVSTFVNNYDTPRSIIEVKFNQIWADRVNGINCARTYNVPAAPGSKVNTDGLLIYYQFKDDYEYTTLYHVPNEHTWIYCVSHPKNQKLFFSVISNSWDSITDIHEQFTSGLIAPSKQDDKTYIGLWHMTGRGEAMRERRPIDTRQWGNLRGNYTPHVQGVLRNLSNMKPDNVDGRVLLMWGPAGTGKTTFFRSIAHEWRDWASLEYVIDPEQFLGSADYMTQVLVSDEYEYDHDTDRALTNERWRLLILEDVGELIKADARKTSSPGALSRLLNMTDGILGEGRNLILAITTNDDITTLHPAVTRPGRCLAQAEIPAFTRDEAEQWLGPQHADQFHQIGDRATLAELFHIKKGSGKAVTSTADETKSVATGQYL